MEHEPRSGGAAPEGRTVSTVPDWLAIVFAAVVLMAPSLVAGTPAGHSQWLNLSWMAEFSAQFVAGDIYPRWVQGLWSGAGGADFFFYAPLPFWLGALLKVTACAGCDADRLIVVTGVIWLALSGLGFRLLARRFSGRWPALAGALAYMMLPYHLGTDWSDRQALGEFAAAAFAPWHLALFLDCLKGRRCGPVLAVLSALVMLCHLPSAVVLAVGCAAVLPFAERQAGWHGLARAAAAAVAGAALAAVYWVPAVAELDSVGSELLYTSYFAATSWLLSPAALLADYPFLRLLWLWFVLLSLVAVPGTIALRRARPVLARLILALMAAVWLLVTPLSIPLWTGTPLAMIQFPFRFLLLADIAFGLAVVLATEALARGAGGRGRAVAASVLVGVLALSLADHPGLRASRGGPAPLAPVAIGALEWQSAEFAAKAGADFYDTGWPEVLALAEAPEVAVPGGKLSLVSEAPRRRVYEADLPEAARAVFRLSYWRYWRLTRADTGEALPLAMADGFPLTVARLPAGRATYVLELPALDSELTGMGLTGLAMLVLAGWYRINRRRTGS